MIQFKNITKHFKNDFWEAPFCALDNVSFNIGEGDIIGFLGPNGAGKTTAMKILMKFIWQCRGEVSYEKSLGANFKEILSNIGYVPERPYFYPHLSARQFTQYMGELSGITPDLLKVQVDKWSQVLGISNALDRKIRGYSKGMLQRLGFMIALLHEPKLIILDEPLAGMDPIGRKKMKETLMELHSQGKTIFFSSHIVSDIEEVCKKLLVLERGKIVYEGSLEKLVNEHIKPSYTIRAINLTGNVYDRSVDAKDKEKFLQGILSQGDKILSVHQDRPTLEQIIYQTRN